MKRVSHRVLRSQAEETEARARANKRLRQVVLTHYELVDEHQGRLLNAADASHKPSCTKGCAHCCYFIVYVEAAEAQAVVDLYPKEVERALPQLRRQQARLQMVTTRADRDAVTMRGDQDALKRVAAAYTDLHEPCGLLDPITNECTIYDVRPNPCRTYFVVSPSEQCAVKHGGALVMDVGGTRTMGHHALLNEVAKVRGGHLRMGTFADTLLDAWEQRAKDKAGKDLK